MISKWMKKKVGTAFQPFFDMSLSYCFVFSFEIGNQ